ncbi:hypothetical protein HDIA_3930 [Hartmannibacter diazotrophicus]|uniref:Four-carbon acid sugar kinase family protein n=1 Tax=Hartmannibacter diazotrophicus TaxID=1482074 RepID=A0A2C9DCL4_9HYPH|nr:four-carbon acid sugar kinase family protein [Hartmannibacter diazotrophicus]SON57471.1 hypothetical protein HDIA_3930 [Hartmannibacter diazotrophicus]
MTLRLALIADDLTGALDTAVPFAMAGLETVVALDVDHLHKAIASGAEVVAVATESRAVGAETAARIVRRAAKLFRPHAPGMVFKKVDSRLKGNVGAESAAIAEVFGLSQALVSPAVPDQGRFVVSGSVTGRGVAEPIAVSPVFEGSGLAVTVEDAADDSDLDRIAGRIGLTHGRLLVGARGLGAALARQWRKTDRPAAFRPSRASLLAIGSRDPITAAQVERLRRLRPEVMIADAPAGRVPSSKTGFLPAVLRCCGEMTEDPADVAERFAKGVRRWLDDRGAETLLASGGDTALSILRGFGVGWVRPGGEVAAGMPWMTVTLPLGKNLCVVVKSGGFGNDDVLAALLPAPALRALGG